MSEVRPIDANALREEFKRGVNVVKGICNVSQIFYNIYNTPTIDYEPVVRCKDCVHWKKEKLYIGNNNAVSSKCEWFSSYSTIVGGIYTHRNDFCSYGAKMDEEVK